MTSEEGGVKLKPNIMLTKKHPRIVTLRGFLVAISILVLLVAGVLITNAHIKNNDIKNVPTGHCSLDLKSLACQQLKAAIPNLDPKKVSSLKPIVARVTSLKNYQKDPNLEYVLTIYYINTSDATNASKNYNLLASEYSAKVGYDSLLSKQAQPLTQLKQIVDALNNFSKNPTYHIFGVSQKS